MTTLSGAVCVVAPVLWSNLRLAPCVVAAFAPESDHADDGDAATTKRLIGANCLLRLALVAAAPFPGIWSISFDQVLWSGSALNQAQIGLRKPCIILIRRLF